MIETQDIILAELTHVLVERFAPEQIVLFGSRARGDHHSDSDYDLMIVLGDSHHTADSVRDAVRDIRASVEIVVDTRERFEHRRTDVGTLEFAADHEGRILYTRAPVREPRRVRETPNDPAVPPESLKEWIARARCDLITMDVTLTHAPTARDSIVFHAHQAVERMLKAVLVSRHVPPPRTQELPQLVSKLPSALRDDPLLAEACLGLQTLWLRSRYPNDPMPTSEQVDQAVAWARGAREIVGLLIADVEADAELRQPARDIQETIKMILTRM